MIAWVVVAQPVDRAANNAALAMTMAIHRRAMLRTRRQQ